jgi:hypothetical protein
MYENQMTPWSSQSFGDPQQLEEARAYRQRMLKKQRDRFLQEQMQKYGAATNPYARYGQDGRVFIPSDKDNGWSSLQQSMQKQWEEEDADEADDYNYTRNKVGLAYQLNQKAQHDAQQKAAADSARLAWEKGIAARNATFNAGASQIAPGDYDRRVRAAAGLNY